MKMKMAFEYRENLMNIVREYSAKYTISKVLDHKEPGPTV